MLNIEKYAEEIKKYITDDAGGISCIVQDLKNKEKPACRNCADCELDAFNWLLQEYKEPILTDEEKIIIKDIIKVLEPFGKELSYISKNSYGGDLHTCYLYFKYEGDNSGTPTFDEKVLFKGMKLNKKYTLEELGLC